MNRSHAWSLDPVGQAAIRRAEDGRTDAVPTLDELFARVGWIIPKSASGSSAAEPENKGDTMPADGLRTERVTLEVTHNEFFPVSEWSWITMLRLRPGESVRVVEETHFDDLAQVVMERDAALRERDEAREECDHLRNHAVILRTTIANLHSVIRERDQETGTLKARVAELERDRRPATWQEEEAAVEGAWLLCGLEPDWPNDEPGTIVRHAESMRREIGRLRDRVAELEAAAAPAANAGGEANQPWPMAFAVWGRGAVCGVSVSREDAGAMQREFAFDTEVMPLYAAPQPPRGWLTAEEREEVQWAADAAYDKQHPAEDTLRALLARETPPRVKVPIQPAEFTLPAWNLCMARWIAAIREAGVEVGE